MPRYVKYERERLVRSYVHVQDEPNVYIAPTVVQAKNSCINNIDICGEKSRVLCHDKELQNGKEGTDNNIIEEN